MLIKKIQDHEVNISPTCGEIHEILGPKDDSTVNVAVAFDIKPTHAHYHLGFEEIYFVLDGDIQLKLYDPATGKIWTESLNANELAVLTPGIHHQIVASSEKNRLCVLTTPHFNPEDEHLSDKL
jgi:mannose-6-phosphate isomerase-like protein (cupin superfamily)